MPSIRTARTKIDFLSIETGLPKINSGAVFYGVFYKEKKRLDQKNLRVVFIVGRYNLYLILRRGNAARMRRFGSAAHEFI